MSQVSGPRRQVKVPEITGLFWVTKIATTVFGEALSDTLFFNDRLGQHRALLLSVTALLVGLTLQFRANRYRPWIYWLAVTSVSVFGTMCADFDAADLGLPLPVTTGGLLVLQTTTFVLWYRSEGTLDIHSITTVRREAFYWLSVVFTFALGSAAGDVASRTLGLGTLVAGFVFLALILLPAAAYRLLGLNGVLAFWLSYTLTRPLGASFADWFGVPAPYGDGLGLGTGRVALVSGVVLLGLVARLAAQNRRPDPAEPAR